MSNIGEELDPVFVSTGLISNKQTLEIEDISVGICAYNEEQNIKNLLDNLLSEQQLGRRDEIIVVCSGSTDSTPLIVKEYSRKDPRIKLIIEEQRLGKASAINKILDNYRGQFVFLIPADVIPEKNSLPLMVKMMSADPKIGVMCGSPIPVNSEIGFSGYMSHLMWRIHNSTLDYLDNMHLGNHASGEFMLVRQGIIDKLPLDVINDDAYIAVMAANKGSLVKYCDNAKVYIKAPDNIHDYIRQRRRVVFGHMRVKQLTKSYPKTIENMMLADPSKSLHILGEEVKKRPKDTMKLLLVVFIEAFVNMLAMFDMAMKRNHTIWAVSNSTKMLVAQGKQTLDIDTEFIKDSK